MSTTTLKLPFKRFVAQVSTGAPRSKSTYLALMAENLAALQACPWREAADVPASLTGHDFTAETQFSDAYDAFKLTGNYDNQAMTEIAYAGMAAYRFKIPASAMTGSVPVASVSLPVSRDRFLKNGLHVAAAISASAEPSADWETIRGSDAPAASSVLAQSAATLMDGSADATTVTLDLSGVSSGNPAAYLWVYVTLEDYTDRWTMYNAKEKRLYAVEGSAMLAGDCAEITFNGTVAADSGADEGVKYIVKPIPVRVTHYEGYHRTLRPKICFTALSVAGGYEPLTSESVNSLPVKSVLLPVATWTVAGTQCLPLNHMLTTDGLHIPEGEYIIECWIDETGDGKFAPGEPYGCTQKINLTASAEPDRIDIELTEVHPSIVRMDIAKMIAGMPSPSARPGTEEGAPPEPYPVTDEQFVVLAAATDRGRWNLPWATIVPARYPGTSAPADASLITRVRIVRDMIIGVDEENDVLLDRYFELSARSVVTEADLIADGAYTLDWGTLNQAFNGRATPHKDMTNATYRIVIGNGDVGDHEYGGNNLPLLFLNWFEAQGVQEQTTPDPECENKTYTGPLTIRWSHTNSIDKPYPSFNLRIYKYDDAVPPNKILIYESGAQRAPARDSNGMYEWTAPVSAGTTTTTTMTVDNVEETITHNIAANITYYWAVSMLDEKFHASDSNQILTPFSFASVGN